MMSGKSEGISVCLLLLAWTAAVSGHHFQFGSIAFQQIATNTVRFNVFTQWKRSFGSYSVFNGSGPDGRAITGDVIDMFGVDVGDGQTVGVGIGSVTVPVKFFTGDGNGYVVRFEVVSYGVEEDFLYGRSEYVHVYEAANDGGSDWLPYLAGCCRETGGDFMVTARVNLAREPLSLVVRALPVMSYPIPAAGEGTLRIALPASSEEGLVAAGWRLAAGTEIGGAQLPSDSAVYFASNTNGNLTVNATKLGVGRFPIVVIISSTGSVVPFDFTLQLHRETQLPKFRGNPLVTDATTALQQDIPMLDGYVGYEVYFTITAYTDRVNASMSDVRFFSLPHGAYIAEKRFYGVPGNSTIEVDFRWLPAVEQAGVHYICSEAIHQDMNHTLNPLTPSTQHCLKMFLRAVNPAPVFTTPVAGATMKFNLASQGTFEVGGLNLNPYDQLTLTPKNPLQYGQALSLPIYTNRRVKATDSAQQVEAFAVFTWVPSAEFGAYKQDVCFILSQQGGPGLTPSSSERCILIEVERCTYIAREGDTFERISQIFGIDWLTLWAVNVNVETFTPPPGMEVQIGRFYRAQPGDTLVTISREFGTSIDKLRSLNYDLREDKAPAGSTLGADTGLAVGSIICILPDTCSAN